MPFLPKCQFALALISVSMSASAAAAPHTGEFTDYSLPEGWQAKITMHADTCERFICKGPATIRLMKNGTYHQTFQAANFLCFTINEEESEPPNSCSLNIDISEDYNFDGLPDLRIFDGNYGAYGIPAHIIYLQNPSGQFVKHDKLTEIEQTMLGFSVDKQRKILATSTKSGCCWYEESHWRFNHKGELYKIYYRTIESLSDDQVKVTEAWLVKNDKWRTRTKRYSAKQWERLNR